MYVAQTGRVLVRALTLIGALVLVYAAYVGFFRGTTSDKLSDTVGRVTKTVDRAIMRPGLYTVQLDEAVLGSDDWTLNAVTGTPKSVHLTVSSQGKEIFKTDLGGFRGKKAFFDRPVTFDVAYDGTTRFAIELTETQIVSDGKRYSVEEVWPFSHATFGKATRLGFTWTKRAAETHQ